MFQKRARLPVTAQVVEFDFRIQLFVPTELELAQHRFRCFQSLIYFVTMEQDIRLRYGRRGLALPGLNADLRRVLWCGTHWAAAAI